MSHFNQFPSVVSLPQPLIPIGTYRIRSKSSNTYLDCTKNGVTMQQSNHGASQEWTISSAADGDYEIRPSIRSQVGVLGVNDQKHLVCNAGGQRFTWNIDPRGPDAYMIGSAANALAIQLPINGGAPVTVDIRNNQTCQRWSLEPASGSDPGRGSSGGNIIENSALHNTFSEGVFAVPGFTWNIQPDLRSIAYLPIATPADFEALQVARWAFDCFVFADPITRPRGGNHDADLTQLGAGWVSPYVFQRLLYIASLHHATRAVPITHPSGTSGEVPYALHNEISSWDVANRNLLSFCFRLYQALVQAGAIATGTGSLLSGITTNTTVTGFLTGTYFEIRPKGSDKVLKTCHFSGEDGAQIQLWRRPSGGSELRAAAFFIDRTGALCHGSGLNVDIVDNVPVLRQRRPVMDLDQPNHWSHPFPRFSYENSQIRIKFYEDPALPCCSERLYPNKSWRDSQYVLVRNSERIIHMHPLSDFQPWALRVPFTPPSYFGTNPGHNSDIQWSVTVKRRSENIDDETLWDIIPLTA